MNKQSKYRLQKVDLDTQWDTLVSESMEATGFLTSTFLNAIPVRKQAYFCYKSQERMGGVLLSVSENGRDVIGHDFIIYDGLFYRDLSHLNRAQANSERFKIQEFVAAELVRIYDRIRISLHPGIEDIRPFLWVNYGQSGPKYVPDVRYTSYLDIADFIDPEVPDSTYAYSQASVARRQEIRYGRKEGVVTRRTDQAGIFVDFYAMTMARQGIEVDGLVLESMRDLINVLLAKGKAFMFSAETAEGRAGSMAIFLLDEKRAYYLFGANDPEMRNRHTGTAVVWDALYVLRELQVRQVDLEGVNSPRRGWFKLSFGGNLMPYYSLHTDD